MRRYIEEYNDIDKSGLEYNLIAVWEKNINNPEKEEYTVKFDSNGGTGTMSDQTFTMNVAQNLTANTFTRTGYTFAGWNTKADGTGTSYKDSQSVTNLTTANNGTVTLYAQWKGTNVAYKVEHYKQQEDKTYKIADTDNKSGTVGTTVKAEQKTYEGYTYNSSKSTSSGTVQADGKLVLKMYYDLSSTVAKYTVKYYKEDSTGKYSEVKEDETTETGTIGEKVTATVKAYEGYMYDNEKSKEYISDEVKEDGSLVLGVYYKKLKNVYLEITVKDSTTQKVKEGVKVTLYTEDGKEISTQISDIVGKVAFENLEKGKTYIYKIEGDSKEYKFKVTEEGKIEYINNEEEPKDDPEDKPEQKPGDSNSGKTDSDSSKDQSQISGQKDDTKATSSIPKAGLASKIIVFVVVVLAGIIVISYIKYKNLNKIC